MTTLPTDLAEIRRDLLAAIAADTEPAASRRLTRRLILAAAAFAVLATAAGAIAAGALKSTDDEERGIVGGWYLFHGSSPTCEQLSATSFHCALERPPTGMRFFDEDSHQVYDVFLGMKAETVDSTLHVDGACVSTRSDGRAWDCYLGQEAVARGLLNPGMLGRYQPEPPTG